MIPHGHLERRRVPRLASVKVRGGIPAAFFAYAAYLLISMCAARSAWARPFFDSLWLRPVELSVTLLALAAVMPDLLRRDGLLEGDLGYRPWTLREVALGLAAGGVLFVFREPVHELIRMLVPGAAVNVNANQAMRGVARDGWTFANQAVVFMQVGLLEELFDRGFMIGAMRAAYGRGALRTAGYLILSSAVFALTHGLGHPLYYAEYALTGALFGLFFIVSRSLNVVMVAHFTLNAIYVARVCLF